jgi:uncharacterized protein YfaP (DUF2135 family)
MTPSANSPVPQPPECSRIEHKLHWAALQYYVKLVGGWQKEEARNAVLQYLHVYPTDPQVMRQAEAHAELIREKIRAAKGGR